MAGMRWGGGKFLRGQGLFQANPSSGRGEVLPHTSNLDQTSVNLDQPTPETGPCPEPGPQLPSLTGTKGYLLTSAMG